MQPNLDNVKKKIQENRDLIDRIIVKFPGFKGYVEKAESYDADRVVRSLIVDRIQGMKNDVSAKSSALVKKNAHASLIDLDALSLRLETVIKKCQHADFGTTASMSQLKISEDDKNRLLEYDWRLITALDDLDKQVKDLAASPDEGLASSISGIDGKLREFEKNFDDRKNVLLEVL